LILVVRPLAVWLATRGGDFTAQETAFVAALAPRGIVAAAIASLIAETLAMRGIDGGADLRALVFLVISGTVVAAGLVAWPLAAVLGLRLPARDRVAILGAHGLGLALANELRAHGGTVVLIDTDPQRCRAAEREKFSVVYGDGLQERTLRRARVELVGTTVGVTFNDNLNSEFARFAHEEFGVPRGLVSVAPAQGDRSEHVARYGADVLFDGPHDQERWDVRWRQGDVTVAPFEFTPVDETGAAAESGSERTLAENHSESYVILTHERNGKVVPMGRSVTLRPGDRASVAIHAPAAEQATKLLTAIGWTPAPTAEEGDAAATA
jgi:Trk K+ transport system NAD-binding subunit